MPAALPESAAARSIQKCGAAYILTVEIPWFTVPSKANPVDCKLQNPMLVAQRDEQFSPRLDFPMVRSDNPRDYRDASDTRESGYFPRGKRLGFQRKLL